MAGHLHGASCCYSACKFCESDHYAPIKRVPLYWEVTFSDIQFCSDCFSPGTDWSCRWRTFPSTNFDGLTFKVYGGSIDASGECLWNHTNTSFTDSGKLAVWSDSEDCGVTGTAASDFTFDIDWININLYLNALNLGDLGGSGISRYLTLTADFRINQGDSYHLRFCSGTSFDGDDPLAEIDCLSDLDTVTAIDNDEVCDDGLSEIILNTYIPVATGGQASCAHKYVTGTVCRDNWE